MLTVPRVFKYWMMKCILYNFLERNSGKIDMLVNTSFNVAGDPIVFDAIDCYVNMSRLGANYIITDNGLYSLKPENKKCKKY